MHVDSVALMVAILGLISLAALAGGIYSLLGNSDAVVRRLQKSVSRPAGLTPQPKRLGKFVAQGLAPLARLAQPTKAEEVSRLRTNLIRAGYRHDYSAQVFLSAKVLLAIAMPLGFLWFNATLPEPIRHAALISVWICGGGYLVPNVWLNSRIRERQRTIEHGLPDALDLLVTCVEAGLGLDAALLRVADEIGLAWRILSDELRLTFLEVKAGINRVEAFRRLADRTGVTDLKSLAATLTQTEIFGTSVGTALRVQASGMRVRRMQRAEEKAAMASVKMTVPLVVFILPSLLAIVVGPAAVNIMERLMPMLGDR